MYLFNHFRVSNFNKDTCIYLFAFVAYQNALHHDMMSAGGDLLMTYKGFTDAQAKAHRKYMEKRATIQLTMTSNQRERIKQRAAALGLSVNQYIIGLIFSDLGTMPTPGGREGGGSGPGYPSK